MNVLDLFSAACGGWSLGMHRAGFRTMAACEAVDWRRVLYSQNNPGVKVYDDVRTLTARRLLADFGYLPSVVVGVRRVRTSAAPTPKAKVLTASAPASSSKPFASSAKSATLAASEERAAVVGSLLRTALISELGALTGSLPHWRQSATPAGHSWSVLTMSAPIMNASGPGSSGVTSIKLPTPIASFQMTGQSNPRLKAKGVIYPAMGPLIEISAGRMEPGKFRGDMEGWAKLATPRKTDGDRGFRGDLRAQLDGQNNRHAGMLHTPTAKANMHHPSMEKWPSCQGWSDIAQGKNETLPTPTKRDKRMDAWSPAYDKRKSPSMDAVMDGALTDRASDKWAYARQIAAVLTEAGLSGASQTLPAVYCWMMGYPSGWLERALLSAVQEGLLQLPSPSKRMATPSSRRSRKQSVAQS